MRRFLKEWFRFLLPPQEWRLAVIILLGIFVGVGLFTLNVSHATSYLSDRPEACINCHVMVPQYATWQRSSHVQVATCVDCHVPHDNIIHKYQFKAKDGLRHASIFTLRQEPQVIRIKEEGKAAVQQNCIRCHTSVVEEVALHTTTYEDVQHGESNFCWDCHRHVPHGRTRSLSAVPVAQVPRLPGLTPRWLDEILNRFEQDAL